MSVPLSYSAAQIAALKAAATEAGLIVLQIISAPAAAVAAYNLTSPREGGLLPLHPDGETGETYEVGSELDRNVAVVDMGGSSTSVSILAARAGVYTLLSSVQQANLGGQQVDEALVNYFAKEFTKKTKVQVEASNARAWAKLRNEAEVTKRALSASPSAQCAVESLAEGVDFAGPINRMRLDMLAGPVYGQVIKKAEEALKAAGLDACQIDEVILAGGSARLPGLTSQLVYLFPEEGHTRITASIDSDQVIARGCAVHAHAIASTPSDAPERKHLLDLPQAPPTEISALKAPTTSKPLGLVLPEPKGAVNGLSSAIVDGQLFVTLLPAHTPLPARRVFTLPASAAGNVLLSFAEGTPEVKVEQVARAKDDDDEDDEELDDDEEDEEEERRTAIVKADKARLAEVSYEAQQKGEKIRVQIVANVDGAVQITVGDAEGQKTVSLPAP